MNAVCLLDTSVLVEILDVPGKSQHCAVTRSALATRIEEGQTLFLPMTTVLETGNHIGQVGDGTLRRRCAQRFVAQVGQALEGKSPFKPISFLRTDDLRQWLAEFPDHAGRGSGLGDLSIIHDWKRLCAQNAARRVYIWSRDQHLQAYDRAAVI
ncbi:hypothetical protein HZU83_07735 [Sphaerotilus montanus]|uniref:PIN domain-containing protein n=1 Tax=Sphaerotilus montanus TaxID=522889 RepID=A0A7Y9R1X8_9BURK|nr:hypothetical protein [Sphaerotilus montanus]NYG33710.1 hypothetical protein [Sphaerotilus montanus]NZD56572.1 hypothetical protein [Sphaerotilus montanus]